MEEDNSLASEWLSGWLKALNLGEYYPTLNDCGYVYRELLLSLSREDMDLIGITKRGHQTRLLKAIEKLQSEGGEGTGDALTGLQDGDGRGVGSASLDNSFEERVSTHTTPDLVIENYDQRQNGDGGDIGKPRVDSDDVADVAAAVGVGVGAGAVAKGPTPPVPMRRSTRRKSSSPVPPNPPSPFAAKKRNSLSLSPSHLPSPYSSGGNTGVTVGSTNLLPTTGGGVAMPTGTTAPEQNLEHQSVNSNSRLPTEDQNSNRLHATMEEQRLAQRPSPKPRRRMLAKQNSSEPAFSQSLPRNISGAGAMGGNKVPSPPVRRDRSATVLPPPIAPRPYGLSARGGAPTGSSATLPPVPPPRRGSPVPPPTHRTASDKGELSLSLKSGSPVPDDGPPLPMRRPASPLASHPPSLASSQLTVSRNAGSPLPPPSSMPPPPPPPSAHHASARPKAPPAVPARRTGSPLSTSTSSLPSPRPPPPPARTVSYPRLSPSNQPHPHPEALLRPVTPPPPPPRRESSLSPSSGAAVALGSGKSSGTIQEEDDSFSNGTATPLAPSPLPFQSDLTLIEDPGLSQSASARLGDGESDLHVVEAPPSLPPKTKMIASPSPFPPPSSTKLEEKVIFELEDIPMPLNDATDDVSGAQTKITHDNAQLTSLPPHEKEEPVLPLPPKGEELTSPSSDPQLTNSRPPLANALNSLPPLPPKSLHPDTIPPLPPKGPPPSSIPPLPPKSAPPPSKNPPLPSVNPPPSTNRPLPPPPTTDPPVSMKKEAPLPPSTERHPLPPEREDHLLPPPQAPLPPSSNPSTPLSSRSATRDVANISDSENDSESEGELEGGLVSITSSSKPCDDIIMLSNSVEPAPVTTASIQPTSSSSFSPAHVQSSSSEFSTPEHKVVQQQYTSSKESSSASTLDRMVVLSCVNGEDEDQPLFSSIAQAPSHRVKDDDDILLVSTPDTDCARYLQEVSSSSPRPNSRIFQQLPPDTSALDLPANSEEKTGTEVASPPPFPPPPPPSSSPLPSPPEESPPLPPRPSIRMKDRTVLPTYTQGDNFLAVSHPVHPQLHVQGLLPPLPLPSGSVASTPPSSAHSSPDHTPHHTPCTSPSLDLDGTDKLSTLPSEEGYEDSVDGELEEEDESSGDVLSELQPPESLYHLVGSSAPKASTSFLGDGGQQPHLVRLGTFAGCGSPRVQPSYHKMVSADNLLNVSNTRATLQESISPVYSRLGTVDFSKVPKTKEGFLHKKGGKRNERPWQKRWIVFTGTELKYFKEKQHKESEARNKVHLGEMIDIKRVNDQEKPNRFDLVVMNRVFQFFADSPEECLSWVNVLHAAISQYTPSDDMENKEGGDMHDPDKQGFLLKQGRGSFNKGFRQRYVALKEDRFAYYESKEHFIQGKPIHILEMSLSSVRPDMASKLPRFTINLTNQKSYLFQAADELERKEWLECLTTAILVGLGKVTHRTSSGTTGKSTTTQEILGRIQDNESNTVCADCSARDPVWGVINRGIMVCINCSGVHRSLGVHISKVRSIELDRHIWTDSLIQLIVEIGNKRANEFWERNYTGERLPAEVDNSSRESYIRAKYELKAYVQRLEETQENLNKLLRVSVKGDDLMRTVSLLAAGADPCHTNPDLNSAENASVIGIARLHKKELQAQLLEHNGARARACMDKDDPSVPSLASIGKKGYLFKTGSDWTGWKRRYCTLDYTRGFRYYKSEADSELLGSFKVEDMLSASKFEEEGIRVDPKYRHLFEVNTQNRGYLFCADNEDDMVDWIKTFLQVVSVDAAEKLGFDKVGYLKKRSLQTAGWKRRWFTLKLKSLSYFKQRQEEWETIDLRKVIELKAPSLSDDHCGFNVILPDRTYHFRAESVSEAEAWFSAIKHTQVSGIPLAEQLKTESNVPILIHKCLQFVESVGMETEGLYRKSGEKSKIRKLILAFNQDARGVVIDPEMYTVHDVTGALKQFFTSLPEPLITHQNYDAFIAATRECQIEEAISRIKQAELEQNKTTISSTLDFLTTIYIGSKQGESYGTKIKTACTVGEVVERVAVAKALPPDNYALYLVLGDSESHRVMSNSERLLAALFSAGTDCFLCLKPNMFADTLKKYMEQSLFTVTLHVRERRKWRKWPCGVRMGFFVQYRDSKLHQEVCRLALTEYDLFAGIEHSRLDVKNSIPTKFSFWLKSSRGEEYCKYLCADSEEDMLRIMASIVRIKYPDCLETPIVPTVHSPRAVESVPKGMIPVTSSSKLDQSREALYTNVKLKQHNSELTSSLRQAKIS